MGQESFARHHKALLVQRLGKVRELQALPQPQLRGAKPDTRERKVGGNHICLIGLREAKKKQSNCKETAKQKQVKSKAKSKATAKTKKHIGFSIRCWRSSNSSVSSAFERKRRIRYTKVTWICSWQLPVTVDVCQIQIEAKRTKLNLAGHQFVFNLPAGKNCLHQAPQLSEKGSS